MKGDCSSSDAVVQQQSPALRNWKINVYTVHVLQIYISNIHAFSSRSGNSEYLKITNISKEASTKSILPKFIWKAKARGELTGHLHIANAHIFLTKCWNWL